jgi:hypothetical protein
LFVCLFYRVVFFGFLVVCGIEKEYRPHVSKMYFLFFFVNQYHLFFFLTHTLRITTSSSLIFFTAVTVVNN